LNRKGQSRSSVSGAGSDATVSTTFLGEVPARSDGKSLDGGTAISRHRQRALAENCTAVWHHRKPQPQGALAVVLVETLIMTNIMTNAAAPAFMFHQWLENSRPPQVRGVDLPSQNTSKLVTQARVRENRRVFAFVNAHLPG
jgi:hypothetical protein